MSGGKVSEIEAARNAVIDAYRDEGKVPEALWARVNEVAKELPVAQLRISQYVQGKTGETCYMGIMPEGRMAFTITADEGKMLWEERFGNFNAHRPRLDDDTHSWQGGHLWPFALGEGEYRIEWNADVTCIAWYGGTSVPGKLKKELSKKAAALFPDLFSPIASSASSASVATSASTEPFTSSTTVASSASTEPSKSKASSESQAPLKASKVAQPTGRQGVAALALLVGVLALACLIGLRASIQRRS